MMKRICNILFVFMLTGIGAFAQNTTLSVSQAIEKALQENYGIMISRAESDIAAINNNWGTAGRYPTIGFDASLNNSYEIGNGSLNNRLSAGIGLDWILFDGFRVNITKSSLENSEELASGRLAVMIENTIEDVILAYYAVLLEQERLEVFRTVMELSRDRYNYEMQKKSLGGSFTYDVLQAENVYLSDQANLLDQEMRVRNAIRNLNFILAEEPDVRYNYSESFAADTSHYIVSALQAKMTESNQTLRNQYVNLQLKQDETLLREAGYYPTVSVSAGMDNSFNRIATSGSTPSVTSAFQPYGNVRLSYDLYRGGVRRRNLEIARINEQTAQLQIDQVEHTLTNELYSLFDYHEVRIQLYRVALKSLEVANLNLQLSEEKYRTGVINSFNYRDVQLIYLEASLRRLQAIYNLIDSKTKLTRITGGFLQVD